MRPTYSLSLGGSVLENRLERLVVTDRAGFSGDSLLLHIRAENLALPQRGVEIDCEVGYEETGVWSVGNFVVEDVKLKGPPDLFVIRCTSQPQGESASAALQLTKRERAWQPHAVAGTTFADIVGEVCSAVGLTARVDNRLASIEMPYTRQSNESDTAFLHRITSERNGLVKLTGSVVNFQTRDQGGRGTINVVFDVDTMEYAFDFTERYNIQSVRTRYQDIESGEVVRVTVGNPGKGVKVVAKLFPDQRTAQLTAEALLRHYQRNFVSATLSMPTRPGLIAEALVNLSGFPGGEESNTQFVCVMVTHTFSRRTGLVSKLSLKRPQTQALSVPEPNSVEPLAPRLSSPS